MTNSKDDRCTRYDGEDGTVETLGDALGPGVTKDTLAETERVLQRFETVAIDEFGDHPDWLRTAHRAVARALDHYDSELNGNGSVEPPAGFNDAQFVRDGLVNQPPTDAGMVVTSGAYALRRTFTGDQLVLYKATEVIQTND